MLGQGGECGQGDSGVSLVLGEQYVQYVGPRQGERDQCHQGRGGRLLGLQ